MEHRIFERYREIVDDWDSFVDALRRPLRPVIWTNTLRVTPEKLRAWLAEEGVDTDPLGWYPRAFRLGDDISPGKSLAFVTGHYHVQEEVSLLPVMLLDPRPGERMLDLCAAPGNKTIQAGVHMESRGTLIAVDKKRQRSGIIRHNLARLGIHCAAVTVADSSSLPRSWGRFDRVLADVPCTCEGTTRRNPEVMLRWQLSSEEQARKQLELLKKAVRICRPGGRVVYSTCTYAPEENEAVVDAVLRDEEIGETLEVLPARIDGFRSLDGLTEWDGRRFDERLSRTMRVFPHLNDTGGFFVAILERGG